MPPKIPTFNLQVSEDAQVTPYKNVSAPVAAFDNTMGMDDLGRGAIFASKAMDEWQEQQDKTTAAELANKFDADSMNILYNKDNGYFNKTGKAAVDGMQEVLENLQKAKDDTVGLAKNNRQKAFASQILEDKYVNLQGKMQQYGFEQNQKWKQDTLTTTLDLQTQRAIVNKYDTKEIYKSIGNARTSVAELSGETDPTILKQKQDQVTSDIHIAVLEGRIGDKALNAKEYYEAHKGEIDATKHAKIEELLKTNDADVRSRIMVDDWFSSGLTEEQAYDKAHATKDLDLRDQLEAKVNQVYGRHRELKNQQYDDNLKNFWNEFEKNPDINNIPAWMDGKDRITAKNFALEGGKGKSDADTYVDLYEMSSTNADAFVKVNLNEYRDRLTNEEFKTFSKRQQDIIAHGYTTLTPDDKAVKKVVGGVLDTYGKWNVPNKQNVTNIMQNLINEEERRTGQKFSAEELKAEEQKIAGWLGYSKEGSSVDVINRNATKADFYRGLANDITYFEKVHKRQPDQKEFHSLLYQRANYAVQDHNDNVYQSIKNTVAKPHETKSVTYFADTYLPNLGKKLGVSISVAPDQRYNPKAKGYKSYHNISGVSRAVDVGMSGRSAAERIRIASNILKDFPDAKFGTSDAVLLRHFAGNANVEDERGFDKQHGTNHVNHLHVTLNNVGGSDVRVAQGTVRMKAPNGRIYAVPEAQVAQYEKIGGIKI